MTEDEQCSPCPCEFQVVRGRFGELLKSPLKDFPKKRLTACGSVDGDSCSRAHLYIPECGFQNT